MSENPRPDAEENAFARDLPGALRVASDTFPAPSPDLIGRGHTRGRRIRRNRRIRIGVAATALAGVALSGAYVVAGLGDDTKRQTASGPTAAVSAPAAAPANVPANVPAVSAAEMLATLKSLLPPGGTFAEESARGTGRAPGEPYGGGTANLVYRGAKGGATGIALAVNRSADGAQCPPRQVRPYAVCTTTPLPDGAALVSSRGFTHPSSNTGQKMWTAEVVRADGVAIEVMAFGGGGEKATTSSVDPLLTIGQLESVVRSPAWAAALTSVAAELGDPPAPPANQGPAGDKILALLKSLLPQGAAVSDENGQPGYAALVAQDGDGESAVDVNVQRGMFKDPGQVPTCAKIGVDAPSCTSETLPDGSTLLLLKQPSEKGGDAVRWSAQLMRPDGFRVVVASINSYAEAARPTRSAPLLDLAELKAIAVDARWATL